MEIAKIHEATSQLSKWIDQARSGEGVIIAKAGRPMARRVPSGLTIRLGLAARGKVAFASPRISTRYPLRPPPNSAASRHDTLAHREVKEPRSKPRPPKTSKNLAMSLFAFACPFLHSPA